LGKGRVLSPKVRKAGKVRKKEELKKKDQSLLLFVYSLDTMRTPDIHSVRRSVNKWLFALILLASVFAFSGLSASPQTGPSPTQSTWIIRGIKPTVKGIRYSTRKQDFTSFRDKYYAALCVASLSQLRSKSDVTRLKLFHDFNLLNAHKMRRGILKTIPQNGKTDPSVLV
jgi:hypothetical protein